MTQRDDLQRFITAQQRDYETALYEIKQGSRHIGCGMFFHKCRDWDEAPLRSTMELRI